MSIYDKLNEQQKKGVFTVEGPVLLLAGAGSGKTGVLTHRIAHMIDDLEIKPYNILAITFTNKAAKEMRERVDKLVGFGADSTWIMTFHATCVRILRRHIEYLGYGTNFTIYDMDDQKTVMKGICKKLGVDTKVYKERNILSQISSAKNEMMGPDQMYMQAGNNYNQQKIAELYREYQDQLKKSNALDFDDIINLTVELFENNQEVLEIYQERFKYIMVDEYQDTNSVQFKLIRLLANKYKNLCVVGDDDQSIYKFRGANIMNILNFEEHFSDAVVIKLEQNYRSTQNILDAANAVIKNNAGRKEKKLWTQSESGDKVVFNIYDDGFEEASAIAYDINRKTKSDYSYQDCAILYRTNAQSRALEEKLIHLNIPYRIYGGVNFYGRKEIKDILAYLKTIDNARDDLAVKRILNIPRRGIGATSMDKIQAYAYEYELNYYEALKEVGDIPTLSRVAQKIQPFINLIEVFRSKTEYYSVRKLIENIVEEVGYIAYLEKTDTFDEVMERKQNIDELISKAAIYEEGHENPTLSGFLEEVALVADIDNLDENKNIVSLMTLHSAKGLEFPIVYLTGMEDGLFPSYMALSSGDESDIEEERRLCYVGITRAKEQLIISGARKRMVRGETQMNRTSRFVKEIPKEYLEEGVTKTRLKPFADGIDHMNLPPRETGKVAFHSYQKDAIDSGIFDKKSEVKDSKFEYKVGDTVQHSKFGVGIVKEIKDGGRDFEVTVEFEKVGIKKMFASFAKLTLIS